MASKADMEQFIIDWCRQSSSMNVTDQKFHEQFFERFGGKRSGKNWGAEPVHKAMRLAAEMWREGKLERGILSNAEPLPGFPNWVYVYSLPNTR